MTCIKICQKFVREKKRAGSFHSPVWHLPNLGLSPRHHGRWIPWPCDEVPSELTQLCWVIRLEFCLKVPHMWKKSMEKGISENSIPCSLLVVGSLHFAKSTDQTAKDTKTELILIVTNNTKLAFDCMTNLLDKKSTNMAGMAGLRWCP